MKASVLLLWACAGLCLGQTSPAPDGFDKASLGWRTALHFDPGAEAPLESLVQLYRAQGRQDELIKIYEDHVARYPADEGALVVLARLYLATSNDHVATFVEKAVSDHPKNALLHHIRFDWLRRAFKPGALEELDRAVALEANGPRRSHWLEELLKLAAEQRSEAIIEARFRELVKAGSLSPSQRPAWARRAMEAGLLNAAEAAMAGLQPGDLTGDEGIEARFVRARLSLARGNADDAAASAAELLDRLATDHWRYREALSLRWEAARSESDRKGLLDEARRRAEQAPTSEAAALNYGELLLSAGREDDALRIWSEASGRLSGARLLEERLLDRLERSGRDEDLLDYLTRRASAERPDLRLRRARILLVMGKPKEGMAAMEDLLANTPPSERAETFVQTARWLRTRLLLAEAAHVLEHLVQEQPDRWDARKELAELLLTLKRSAELEKLFDAEPPAGLPREVRLEVAQFLFNHRMWAPCRRLLEEWVNVNPVEFDGRLVLFKTYFLLGEHARADRVLEECRALCDTDTRYAAWLSAAWWSAQDEGAKQRFLEQERQRLWPATGSKWEPANLSRLTILIGQTQDSEARDSVEVLLRRELQDPALPPEQKAEARRDLIRMLTGLPGREKDLETEIRAALETPGEPKGNLMLELVKLYSASQRSDLATNSLASVDPADCTDASLLVACANVATMFNQTQRSIQFLERAIELEPDERTYWSALLNALLAVGDEETLRLTLRALLARSSSWDLPEWQRNALWKHLESSYWRSVGRCLMTAPGDSAALHEALTLLDELDAAAAPVKQLRWSDWARGVIHVRLGNAEPLEAVRRTLSRGDGEWIKLPDGLSLSRRAALAHLTPGDPLLMGLQRAANKVDKADAPQPPLHLHWVLESDSGTHWMRWCLTKDATTVLAVDSRNLLWAIDSATGKLRWKRPLPQSESNSESVPLPFQPSRGEQISTPPEWCIADSQVFLLNDGFLAAIDTVTGDVKWTQEVRPTPNQGLACADGTVFWWRPQDGQLDAVDAASGKLLWSTQPLPPWPPSIPGGAGAVPSSSLQWYASGIAAESGKVLIWCNGSALVAADDGSVLWQGSAANELAGSAITLSSGQAGPNPPASVPVLPWEMQAQPLGLPMRGFGSTPFSFGSILAAPMYAYPGMFGNSGTTGIVTWGATSFRLLKGGAVWSASPVGLGLNTTAGLPVSTRGLGFNRNGAQGTPVGFAGNALILADGTGITREDPLWGSLTLWNGQIIGARRNQPRGPLPCAALAGTSLLLAVDDTLRIQDAISGSIIWQGGWPEEAKPWLDENRNGLANWQNVRWSSHGLLMNDGRGSTMAVDWKGLAVGREWIVPCGTRALVCLRGAGSALESGHEDRVSD